KGCVSKVEAFVKSWRWLGGVGYIIFFFFQAEDGIRDGHVTGVQTCALPISVPLGGRGGPDRCARARALGRVDAGVRKLVDEARAALQAPRIRARSRNRAAGIADAARARRRERLAPAGGERVARARPRGSRVRPPTPPGL